MKSYLETIADQARYEVARLMACQPEKKTEGRKRSEAGTRAALTRWSNPEYRAMQSRLRLGRKFPRQAASLSRRWKDPDFKSKIVTAMKASPKIQASIARAREVRLTKIAARKSNQ